ncbi:MAG: xanthine dehydrogenase family protein molybdopterin-binding subunit, partial [Planctomycetota bacterium]
MTDPKVIHTRARRLDAADKARGLAVYADDMTFPGMLHAVLLQSPHAHARIRRIDPAEARALPQVAAVITAEEAGDVLFGVSPARYDERVFAESKVRYVGDEVAAVAAEDEETALRALPLIDVEYEILPAVLDPFDAMEEGAPRIHDRYKGNIAGEVHQEFGDVETAEQEAEAVVSGELTSKMQDAAFLEPQACVARYDERGYLTLWSPTQAPHYVQRTLAMVLGIPLGRVQLAMPAVG